VPVRVAPTPLFLCRPPFCFACDNWLLQRQPFPLVRFHPSLRLILELERTAGFFQLIVAVVAAITLSSHKRKLEPPPLSSATGWICLSRRVTHSSILRQITRDRALCAQSFILLPFAHLTH
jgi:hypothetical protein